MVLDRTRHRIQHFITKRHADNVDDIDWDDIRYTRCQAELFEKVGVTIPETHIHDFPDQNCDIENEVGKVFSLV